MVESSSAWRLEATLLSELARVRGEVDPKRGRGPCLAPLILLLVVFLFTGSLPVLAEPDIVLYLSDDHSQFDCSLYGAKDIPTPNFEKLAAEGMTFTHAFVASPSCAPSRAAMLTGLMPARNGAEANHTYPREGTHFLIDDLKSLGYEVASFGKVAHGRDQRYVPFDSIRKQAAYEPLRTNVRRFLTERKKNAVTNKPLCLCVGISNPHVPWPNNSAFDPDNVTLPPHHIDTPATRVHRAAYYQEIKEVDALMGELREMSSTYLGDDVLFMHTSDHGSQWPFGKWNLYDYGIRVPLLVSWPGKIKAGVRSDAMVSWIDILPTLIDLAGGPVPEELDGRSFGEVLLGKSNSHRDRIFTTQTGDGRMNVYPIRSVRTRRWKLIRNLHPEFAFTNHSDLHRKKLAGAYWTEWAELAKTDARARQIVDRYYERPEWELFDVANDKWEQTNQINEPKHAELVAELKVELGDWIKSQGDELPVFKEPRLLKNPRDWHPDFDNRQKPEPARQVR